MNYYNDNDPFSVKWLRNLIDAGLIPNGDVDDRSITEIRPSDLDGYVGVHFFAGIGGWPYALRLAGWPDDRTVWTGSCPCQPFSVAGKGGGLNDERHLWPAFRWLIAQRRPAAVFGEQVASKDGRLWLTGVRTDLEAMGYAVGAADLCAAGIGAPNIRQRLFWVADAKRPERRTMRQRKDVPGGREQAANQPGGSGENGRLAHTESDHRRPGERREKTGIGADGIGRRGFAGGGPDGRVGNASEQGLPDTQQEKLPGAQQQHEGGAATKPSRTPWSDSILIPCADGRARRAPVEPALFPLADGLPGRVGLLRGAGNAIVPQLAAEFIAAFQDCEAARLLDLKN